MSPDSILFDARWLNSGGIGRFCQEIMQSESIVNAQMIQGDLFQALSALDPLRLSQAVNKQQYFISPGYNCPLFSKGRAIVTIHDLMHLNFKGYSSLKNTMYYDWVVKRAVRSAPLVFTVSEFSRNETAKWADISIDKIAVVPNGVDHEFYHPNVDPIVRDKPYLFYVGNNKEHKNLPRLIRAFAASELQAEVDLVLSCGDTEELSELVWELGLQESVVFLNGIDETLLPSYYKGALASVLVSLYEGFCLPVLESMAVGTPVITSNVTAMPETAGDAALFVNPTSEKSIKDALLTIKTDAQLVSDLRVRGLKRAKEFAWHLSREKWDRAITEVLEIE
ncbi:glycosyltransferase family 4 protein [Marinomonas sp.]